MDIKKIFEDIANVALPLIRKYREEIQNLEVRKKEDQTLLTEADIAVQMAIVEVIHNHNPNCGIIAEENTEIVSNTSNLTNGYTWIIDPIDGTKEFVSPEGKEFCIAICVIIERMPIGAMVLLPELGLNGKPVLIEATSTPPEILLNDSLIVIPKSNNDIPKRISATRSSGTDPRPFESQLSAYGCTIKTRTTSQTIDLVRVAVELSECTESHLDNFNLFYREKQKFWDGAPGIFLNHVAGRVAVNEKGESIIPFSKDLFDKATPTLPVSIVGTQDYVSWFLKLCKHNHDCGKS